MSKLIIENLSKTYPSPNGPFQALKNIHLTLGDGEIMGIIGKSGAGKSSLIRCVNYLEKPTSGSVLVNDQDLSKLSRSQLAAIRQRMGMIFQHFNLLSRKTVFENIALPLVFSKQNDKFIQNKVRTLMDFVGLKDKEHAYPAELSGGQKQRVAIARALVSDPYLLLCDEATSALDPQTTQAILRLLKTINKDLGLSILLITHEIEVIKTLTHRVAVMDKGEIVELSTCFDLFRLPQSPLSKEWVHHALNDDLSIPIQNRLLAPHEKSEKRLIRLHFFGSISQEPILSDLIKHYPVSFNILQANLNTIQDQAIGTMIIELAGPEESIQAIFAFFKTVNIQIEELGYVS